jgi:hypothetical protein
MGCGRAHTPRRCCHEDTRHVAPRVFVTSSEQKAAVLARVAEARNSRRRPKRKQGRGRAYKKFPGEAVELAVRQLRPWDEEPGRNAAAKKSGLSTKAVDRIIELMKAGILASADEKGWLLIDGDLGTTPKFIVLADLETLL